VLFRWIEAVTGLLRSRLSTPRMMNEWTWSSSGLILTQKNRTRRESCPNANLSPRNPTSTDRGANPGLRGENLAE
jgi:hypothetical protein